jgi:hypothetical protein
MRSVLLVLTEFIRKQAYYPRSHLSVGTLGGFQTCYYSGLWGVLNPHYPYLPERRYPAACVLAGEESFFDVVFFPEAFNAARGIHELLLAGKKGMAGRTNFHFKIFFCGTGFNHVPTGTGYGGCFIFGMNLVSHNG